ncbi:MAG: hypothetical protein HT580_16100 [Dechloromonas sp.]|nr:MAG: hypothetical protein HT580_16100 [Dechloromonas sp.]
MSINDRFASSGASPAVAADPPENLGRFGITMAELLDTTSRRDDKAKVFSTLMLDEEQAFFVETLQRYRSLLQQREL